MILSLGLVVPQAQVPTALELTIPHFGHFHESDETVVFDVGDKLESPM